MTQQFRWLFYVACITVLVPRIAFGDLQLGLDDLVALLILTLFTAATVLNRFRLESGYFGFVTVALTIFVVIFSLMGILNSILILGDVSVPTELWQYFKRLAFFIAGFYMASHSLQGFRVGLRLMFLVGLVALSIGVLQYMGGAAGEWLAALYARSDHQLSSLVERGADVSRVYGVSGHSISWGGYVAFMLVIAMSAIVCGYKTLFFRSMLSLVLLLGCLNVLTSGSRIALVAALWGLFVVAVMSLTARQIGRLHKVSLVILITLPFILAMTFLKDRLGFIAYRFAVLGEQQGGTRADQVSSGLDLFDSAEKWAFGVSNAVQRSSAIGHGIEVEPIYLLVNYGVFGFAILAAVMCVLFLLGLNMSGSKTVEARTAGYALVGGVSVYMVFWLGYFFFQEAIVGLFFWLLAGLVVGLNQRTGSGRALFPVSATGSVGTHESGDHS